MHVLARPDDAPAPYTPHLHALSIDGRLVWVQTDGPARPHGARSFGLQLHGAQRAVTVATPLEAQLRRFMPAGVMAEAQKMVKSPMTGAETIVAAFPEAV